MNWVSYRTQEVSFLPRLINYVLPLPFAVFVARIFTWVSFWVFALFFGYQLGFGELNFFARDFSPGSEVSVSRNLTRLVYDPPWHLICSSDFDIVYCRPSNCDTLSRVNEGLVIPR